MVELYADGREIRLFGVILKHRIKRVPGRNINTDKVEQRDYLAKELALQIKSKRVLDIGCDLGWQAGFIFDAAKTEVTGLDMNRKALQAASESYGLKPCLFDVNRINEKRLPFPDGYFDIVFVCEVLEHVLYPKELISEICRVLRRGGAVIGSFPNGWHFYARLKFLFGGHLPIFDTESHIRMFDEGDIRNMLSRFQGVSVFYAGKSFRYPVLGGILGTNIIFRGFKKEGKV